MRRRETPCEEMVRTVSRCRLSSFCEEVWRRLPWGHTRPLAARRDYTWRGACSGKDSGVCNSTADTDLAMTRRHGSLHPTWRCSQRNVQNAPAGGALLETVGLPGLLDGVRRECQPTTLAAALGDLRDGEATGALAEAIKESD